MLEKKAIELNVNEQVEFYKNVTYRLVLVVLESIPLIPLLMAYDSYQSI